MKFSVITAVRNASRAIAPTLESVARQSNVAVEHVVVDGASTDGTLDVVNKHVPRPAKVVSEPDSGIYDAFNKGLALATGDIITYLNAGDSYLTEDVLSRVASQFDSGRTDAAFGDVLIVSAGNTARVIRRYRSAYFTPERMKYGFMPAHTALFVRREVYDRVGGYDTTYRQAGDFEFCVRAFLKNRISYVHIHEFMVRMPAGGVSNRGIRSKMINTREFLRACNNNNVPTNYLTLSLRLPIKALEVIAALVRLSR